MYRKYTDEIRFCLSKCYPVVWTDPDIWAEKNLDFSDTISASHERLDFNFSPFLRDPIRAWDFSGVKREVTVVAPEQTGKTLCWLAGLLWSFIFKACLSMVVYKSDDKAEEINEDKMKPLLKKVRILAKELLVPRSSRKDHYNFSNLKSYFKGSGTRISSTSSMINVADELDDWEDHEGYASNLDDLRKRAWSFLEGILYKVCTIKAGGDLKESKIWKEFLASSRGYWHLRCQGCRKLTIRSCDIHHLQFESDDHIVKPGSCYLVCPKCGFQHGEIYKRKMNIEGAFIHERPELIETRPGFQWAALAVQNPDFCWDKVAQAQLEAGTTGDLAQQILFDNSYRSLPFKRRRRHGKRDAILKSHRKNVPDELKYVLMSVDTQDNCFFWVVRGFDEKYNSYLLDHGSVVKHEELTAIWNKKYNGLLPEMGIIDSGGHRPAREIAEILKEKPGFWAYKGRGQLAYRRWERSKENKRLILCNPLIYKIELLSQIYTAEETGNNFWYINKRAKREYYEQVLDYHPDNTKRSGNNYENWISTGNDHYFDCEKMLLLLNEMYNHFKKELAKKEKSKRGKK